MTAAADFHGVESLDPRIHFGDEQTLFALKREYIDVEVIARFTVDGEPVSKARARFTNRGSKTRVYTPEKTRVAEERVAWSFREVAPWHEPDNEFTYGVMAVFFSDTRQRRDVDNMLKLICDGLNGVAWHDDVQVEEIAGRRGRDLIGNARTDILIYRIGKIQRPEKACLQCKQPFLIYNSTSRQKYCSAQCRSDARKANRVRTCTNCGETFEANPSDESTRCSRKCRTDATTKLLVCVGCGTSFRRPQSWVKTDASWCSRTCQDQNLTHCKHGHEFTPENVYRRPSGGARECRTCRAASSKARRTAPSPPTEIAYDTEETAA
ncbi:RusA family crossover junction endodeoxyribonuclease [Nocardia sp. NPDC060249]|uniref:RusA family crossover junction endodeoxyribonuclease n=1 Tax=Nocardia sp. NPDC060249 TaxID=3347082 RepID=UPI0036673BD7